MNRLKTFAILLAITAACFASGCSKSGDGPPKKADIPGACECALDCANTITVDDTAGLVECQKACQGKFGTQAMAEGTRRSMEVMTEARESCAD